MVNKPYFRLVVVVVALLVIGILQYEFHIIPVKVAKESVVPTAVELPTEAPKAIQTEVTQSNLPSFEPSSKVSGPQVRINVWAWNAQMGLIYANGGPKTTKGSLMEQHNVRLQLIRQDDTDKSKEDQIKFANGLAKGDPNPAQGTHFVIIMGDQSASYLATINATLKKLGNDFRAEIVGAVGWSGNDVSGEDCFMGPEDWKTDPTKMKGALIAGAVREGDWNIGQYYAQQNNIKNNPDETTWDPEALNWVNIDYMKAAELYINGHCEDRPVVRNGKITAEAKHHVCVQGVATWTPGDVNVAKKKGGLVKLLSTKENTFQMPAVLIGIHKWNVDHAKVLEGLLAASFEGADQVKNFEPALQQAGKASYKVYDEESPAYWVRYYRGVVEKDRTGNRIALGGSRVAPLGDNLVLFGLADGSGDASSSMFRATYEGFGNVVRQQYPKLVPEFPPVSEAVNLDFLRAVAATAKVIKPDLPQYEDDKASISEVVAQKNWNVQFESGKATFTRETRATLDEIFNVLSVNKLYVQLEGHTDNTGSTAVNGPLSEARAQAVKDYLVEKAPSLFTGRVTTRGFGDSKPLASNATAEGRATNRRVTVIMGNK